MTNLLETEPGTRVVVIHDRLGEKELAKADEKGAVRDSQGRSYSAGAYSIYEVRD